MTDSYRLDHSHSHGEVFDSGRSFAIWLTVGVVGFLLVFLSLSAVHIFSPGLKPQDIADHDLTAPETTQVIDRAETAKAVERAKQSIIPVFQVDKSRNIQSITAVETSLDRVAKLQQAGIVPVAAPAPTNVPKNKTRVRGKTKATRAAATAPSPAAAPAAPRAPDQSSILAAFRATAPLTTDQEVQLAQTIKPQDFPAYRQVMLNTARRLIEKFHRFPVADRKLWVDIVVEFLPETMAPDLKQLSAAVLAENLEPNLVIDPDSTRSKAAQVVKTVQPVMKSVTAGDVIVPRGSIISQEKLELLQALGVTHINRWPFVFSIAISLIAALTLVALFLYTYEPKHFFSAHSLGLLFSVTFIVCALASLIGKTYPQFVPLPALALILTIFFGNRLAIVVTLPVLMLIAVDRLLDSHHLVSYVLASMVAIFSYSKGRNAVLSTAVFIAIAQVIGDLAASAMDQSIVSWHMLVRQLGLDFLGGIASSIVAIGSLPFLENIFGLITPFRIAELTDANQPLLRRLEENAPGTYQHSLAVANLAEAGAKAISADANLVRAGALYHDIGKMVRPKYFIENQLGATNPHDSMSPEDSRARVLAHVTDGIALAEKYALPKAIQDFIPMHQGTTLMAYFYHKACLRDGVDKVDANFYRYPGPRPNSKETAIVMLADVSEAVTHSMHDPSQEEVEQALEKVFQNRWEDGQFLDSGLTYDELMKVKSGFARVWRTLHHERLKYPATTTGKMPVPPSAPASSNGNAVATAAPVTAANETVVDTTGGCCEPNEDGLGI
ncbi:MAG: HDIG domain-containing protein [Cyanobacteria bacterium SZAS LIN-2]|nr:HDIG domain-containing protein [Cyanobacteria bacterium SZAS LIN-2]MBS2007219.1 HDIG domain-containing protein [Cyanobacteria bacterium SZAS TMP-1]